MKKKFWKLNNKSTKNTKIFINEKYKNNVNITKGCKVFLQPFTLCKCKLLKKWLKNGDIFYKYMLW